MFHLQAKIFKISSLISLRASYTKLPSIQVERVEIIQGIAKLAVQPERV